MHDRVDPQDTTLRVVPRATRREGVSGEFPDEAMPWLVRSCLIFDVAIVAAGVIIAATGGLAAGAGVAALGLSALLALAILSTDRGSPSTTRSNALSHRNR